MNGLNSATQTGEESYFLVSVHQTCYLIFSNSTLDIYQK